MMQASLLDQAPSSEAPSLKAQILAVDLWIGGLNDWMERLSSGKNKRPDHDIARKRDELAAAKAVLETLRAVERGERRASS